jgi:selenocysteine-specific elongation factor
VEPDVVELALEEARELVPGAEVIAVSARTGAGLDDLRAALGRAADAVARPPAASPTRLWIDRSFTLRGIGTVVTGTLWSGSVGAGDELRLEPSGETVRVRSVQVHDRDVGRAEAGQRVAVSLPGVERRRVRRGDVLVEPGAYPVSYRIDVTLDELEPIPDRARLQAHLGSAHVACRVVRIGDRWAQLRLAEPVAAARGDRVILRGETTVGGAVVLDPAPPRHRDLARMELLERGDVASMIDAPLHLDALRHGLERVERGDIAATVHAPVLAATLRHVADGEPKGLVHAGPWLLSARWLHDLEEELGRRIEAADPIDPGVAPPSEPWAADVLPLLPFERRGSKLYVPGAVPTLAAREEDAAALERELASAGVRATKVDDAELARFLEARGTLVRLGDGYAIGAGAYEVAKDVLLTECRAEGRITLARFRDLAGTGRRDAQLLLERFDGDGLTRRVGEARVLRRAAADQPLNTQSS